MKSIIIIIFLVVGAITSRVKAQGSLPLLQDFMRDVINPDIKERMIIDTYLCQYLHDVQDNLENKNYLFAKGQITGFREYIQKENIKLKQLKIIKYIDIQKKDQNVNFDDKDDVYACYYKNKVFNFFSVRDNKIVSFTTMNKSGQRFFIYHCQ